jgi:2,3-bisphosphoglycerate-independent phosphoglycerate mutase
MKGIIMIIDGMGDRPIKELGYKTPLEAANTPNMDKMAELGICGIMDPIRPGIRAGSDTSHISILGYDPYEVYTGRGPFEAAGVGLNVLPGDIAFRCNFSTADDNGIITDRRAGRIREGTEEISAQINGMEIADDVEIIFKESTGHRAVLVLRGEDLSDQISDADPKHDGNPPKKVKPLDDSKEAKKTAEILNKVVIESYNLLKDHPINLKRIEAGESPANIIIPRGAGAVPYVEPFGEKYGLKPVCIAETGLIKGIASIAGMELIDIEGATGGVDTNLENIERGIL